jgi:hypothetical protein
MSLVNRLDDASDSAFLKYVPTAEDSWIAFYPEQIKLADGTNTTFETDSKDIRYDNGGSTSWDKLASASSRFRPYETIVFEPPLIGLNGAKLTSYTWAYEMTMQPNWEGELVGKRVSDWTQAEISAETGRGIVHRYTVELPDGSVKVVSSESVPILMGYVDRTQAKVFGNLATASKTLAKQQMALAIMEAKYKEYLDAIQSVKDKGFPEPHVEKSESLSGYKLFVGDGSCYINENGTYDRERLDCAKSNYINNRLKEMGIDVYSANRSSAIYDLKNRVARQKRKVEQMLKTPNMELGGNIENSDLTEMTLNRVYTGEINSDDAAIELDESGIEVDHDLYERLRDAEKGFLNKNRGLQVGDTITVKGKHGNSDFKGNFRGFTNEGKLVVVYGGGNQMVIGKDDYYENGGTTDDFDWESLFNPSPEQQEKIRQEIKKSEEQEKEDWYQNSRFSKKWAATYQDAVNRTVKEYLDAKATYEDWGSRQYKSNKGVVYAGGDDIHGTAYTIGGINEYRRKKTMAGAKMLMDESIETLKDLGLTDEEISNLLQNKMKNGGNVEDEKWVTCPKCGGSGELELYRHINAGVCFECGGKGVVPNFEVKEIRERMLLARKKYEEKNKIIAEQQKEKTERVNERKGFVAKELNEKIIDLRVKNADLNSLTNRNDFKMAIRFAEKMNVTNGEQFVELLKNYFEEILSPYFWFTLEKYLREKYNYYEYLKNNYGNNIYDLFLISDLNKEEQSLKDYYRKIYEKIGRYDDDVIQDRLSGYDKMAEGGITESHEDLESRIMNQQFGI